MNARRWIALGLLLAVGGLLLRLVIPVHAGARGYGEDPDESRWVVVSCGPAFRLSEPNASDELATDVQEDQCPDRRDSRGQTAWLLSIGGLAVVAAAGAGNLRVSVVKTFGRD
jgi:hypothetical protein